MRRTRSLAHLVCVLDLAVLVGFVAFVVEVIRIEGLGPPPAWTLLQALGTLAALLTLALVAATATTSLSGAGTSPAGTAGRLVLTSSAVLFVLFMLYWNLTFVPSA